VRVAINCRLLYEANLRGWNRYTVNLIVALSTLGIELLLYSDRPLHEAHWNRLSNVATGFRIAPPMPYPLWEQCWVPYQCLRDRVDLFHSPCNFGLSLINSCAQVLTIHDAIDFARGARPHRRSFGPHDLLPRVYSAIARFGADRVITVSEHSRGDLEELLGIQGNRISVTYEAADARFDAPIEREVRERAHMRCGIDRPYVLYVGGWEERKNVPYLLKSFAGAALPDVDLLLCGGTEEQRNQMRRRADSTLSADRVRLLGWVDDEFLPTLYADALCFAYPSRYEGFGLQLVEAMSVGCPILAARATCLPEILGEGGETFALDDDGGELSAMLRRVSVEPRYRDVLKQRSRSRSASFSWQLCAAATVEAYARAIESHSHRRRFFARQPRSA
jgi:hypothetical protein